MSKGKIYTAVQGQTTYGEAIGIIMIETFMPFPPGSPGNATTFDYPVRYTVVKGATMDRVVFDPDPNILPLFVEAGRELVSGDSSVKVILFECTDLPPYAVAVQRAVDLPVFDYTTMINYVHSSLVRKPFTGYQ